MNIDFWNRPKASDERILRATEILLRRQVVDITLLGNEAAIKTHAASLGLNIEQAQIIDPLQSEHIALYTETLYQLRKHKGVTPERAADAIADVSYFATMMVYMVHADGMVSGAVHTTEDTIRPALQIIKTTPHISLVSSVFIMCLETQVLVYGDCAVNPDPMPNNWPKSVSARLIQHKCLVLSPALPCCPTLPAHPVRVRMWTRFTKPPRLLKSDALTC